MIFFLGQILKRLNYWCHVVAKNIVLSPETEVAMVVEIGLPESSIGRPKQSNNLLNSSIGPICLSRAGFFLRLRHWCNSP